MASRIPLVMVNGQISQLPSGDVLNASSNEVDVITATNANAGAIVIGAPVYISAAGSVDKAQATAANPSKVIGLVRSASIAAAGSGSIQTDGVLAATTGEWDVITGATGGLTAGSDYFLDSAAAGKLTTTAPSSVGQYVTFVGRALSTTDMEISIARPIAL